MTPCLTGVCSNSTMIMGEMQVGDGPTHWYTCSIVWQHHFLKHLTCLLWDPQGTRWTGLLALCGPEVDWGQTQTSPCHMAMQ